MSYPSDEDMEEVHGDLVRAINDKREEKQAYAPAFIRTVLESFGLDVRRDENFRETPERWLKYLKHYCQPYDPAKDLGKVFYQEVANAYEHAMIVQGPIPYQAVCAHHLLPVLGTAHVGYIPKTHVVGLSKLTRLVYGYAHESPSLQEDVGNKIVDAIMEHLDAIGAMCVISAEHGCMAARGVERAGILTTTSSIRGVFTTDHRARVEMVQLISQAK